MNSMGYTKFKDIDCVFYEEKDCIRLIPTNQTDNIVKFLQEKDFIFTYYRNIHKCTAFIKKVEMTFDNKAIRLVPKYIFESIGEFRAIHGFNIVGDAFDDFFNPANYFLLKHRSGEEIGNLVYGRENVDVWKIKFENMNITISLSYGEILNRGRNSDLMLHPKLNINFDGVSNDLDFIYRAYKLIVKFIQLVRYDLDVGWYSMALVDDSGYECGKFYEIDTPYTKQYSGHQMELNYITYKPFIGRLLQFAADNFKMPLGHLPRSSLRVNFEEYDPMTFVTIFGSFEDECRAKKDLYIKADIATVEDIRKKLIKEVKKFSKIAQTVEEKTYIEKVISRIGTTDTGVGLKKKIVNSYNVLLNALESSVPNIFYLYDDDSKKNFSIDKISDSLSDLRGAIAHGDFNGKFTEAQTRQIYFLEILVYAQMLKRAGLNDSEIELILGIIFSCNIKHYNIID